MTTEQDRGAVATEYWAGNGTALHGVPSVPAQPPETQAKEFFDAGGVVVPDEPVPGTARRRWWVGAVGVVVVAVVIVAVAVGVTHGTSGKTSSHGAARPSTANRASAPLLSSGAVVVQVLNASGSGHLAGRAAVSLRRDGFVISGVHMAPGVLSRGQPSGIFYGPTGLSAAHTLAHALQGPVAYVPDHALTGNNVSLWIADPGLTVKSARHRAG
ncbi:MAG: LytR C-terminal domain-containing protein [Acidimicrobiales bacterium]